MQALDLLSNIASHHGTMLSLGSLVAVLPVVLTLIGRPAEDPGAYTTPARTDSEGHEIPAVQHDRSHPRTHQLLRGGGFFLGLLQAYSGYLTITTGSQDIATAGALFLNAALLTSRVAKDVRWAFPAAAAGGGVVWVRFLQVMEASPPAYVTAGGWLVLSLVLLYPALYAEGAVKFVGDATGYSPPAALLGSIGGLQAVLLAMGLSISVLPPLVMQWLAQYLTQFGGF